MSAVRVLTHNGRFHCDEVCAIMLIELLEGELDINRSRNVKTEQEKQTYKWIVDVGGEYIPEHNRFDHHQESCKETWSPKYHILLSSSGMVYKHYWPQILDKFGWENATEEEAELVYKQVFLPIDSHDNGQQTKEYYFALEKTNLPDGIKMGQVVANMNSDNVFSKEQDQRFKDAMHYCFISMCPMISSILKEYRNNTRIIELLKDPLVCKADYPKDNGILVLPDGEGTFINKYILAKIDKSKKICFTIYKKGENYGFSAVQDDRFKNRVDLIPYSPKYEDLIFIHKNLFCGEAKTLETAKLICLESIRQHKLKRNLKIAGGVLVCSGLVYLLSKF